MAFNEDQPRDSNGRWSAGIGDMVDVSDFQKHGLKVAHARVIGFVMDKNAKLHMDPRLGIIPSGKVTHLRVRQEAPYPIEKEVPISYVSRSKKAHEIASAEDIRAASLAAHKPVSKARAAYLKLQASQQREKQTSSPVAAAAKARRHARDVAIDDKIKSEKTASEPVAPLGLPVRAAGPHMFRRTR